MSAAGSEPAGSDSLELDELQDLRLTVARAIWNRLGGRGANLPEELKNNLWQFILPLTSVHLDAVLSICTPLATGADVVRGLAAYPYLQQMANYIYVLAEKSYVPGGRPIALEPFSETELADTFGRAAATLAAPEAAEPFDFGEPVRLSGYVDLLHGSAAAVRPKGGQPSDDLEDDDMREAIRRSLCDLEDEAASGWRPSPVHSSDPDLLWEIALPLDDSGSVA